MAFARCSLQGLNIDRCILTLATLITPCLIASQFRLIFTVIFSQVPLTSLFSPNPPPCPSLPHLLTHPINRTLSSRFFMQHNTMWIKRIKYPSSSFRKRKKKVLETNDSFEENERRFSSMITQYIFSEVGSIRWLRTVVSRVDIVSRVLRGSLPFLTRFTDTRALTRHSTTTDDDPLPPSGRSFCCFRFNSKVVFPPRRKSCYGSPTARVSRERSFPHPLKLYTDLSVQFFLLRGDWLGKEDSDQI